MKTAKQIVAVLLTAVFLLSALAVFPVSAEAVYTSGDTNGKAVNPEGVIYSSASRLVWAQNNTQILTGRQSTLLAAQGQMTGLAVDPGQRYAFGGFVGGCGHEKHFDCPVWPVKGVIGVTLNYRLGPLGFAALPELKQEAGFTGNYGLFDQLAALRWVRENIAAFGGDPEKITLMGQSAGGMSVQLHCESPLSDGLISGAVISSGTLDKLFPTPMPEKYYDFWHAVMADCGCDTLEAFRNAPVERLFAAWKERSKEQKGGGCFPCMDGRLVPETPAGTRKKPVPCMVGSTSEDVVPALLHRACKDCARTQEKKSYAWYFDRRLPGDGKGAWHSSDLWYWFGTLPNCWRPMTEKDYDLSRQMTDYLANFCKYGDPNGGGLAAWLPMVKGQRKVLCLGEGQTRMGRPDVTRLVKNTLTSKAKGE